MIIELWQLAAALYFAAVLWIVGAAMLPGKRTRLVAALLLGVGALAQGVAFARLHTLDPPPPLTDFPSAMALMGWVAVILAVLLLLRGRLQLLAAPVALLAFFTALYGSVALGGSASAPAVSAGRWPHLHVILASAGLAALGIAALAGLIFLWADRALKQKRPLPLPPEIRRHLPSLEALDRVNQHALVLGFPVLTVGVVAGFLWTQGQSGDWWPRGAHGVWSGLAWALYLGLVLSRFAGGWRGRRAALCAAGGFALLVLAYFGAEAVH